MKTEGRQPLLRSRRELLENLTSADIMSFDMKAFTVRDLDRSPNVVLEASRADGRARVRERGGRTYIITPEVRDERAITSLPDFQKRRHIFRGTLSAATVQQLDNTIAGMVELSHFGRDRQ